MSIFKKNKTIVMKEGETKNYAIIEARKDLPFSAFDKKYYSYYSEKIEAMYNPVSDKVDEFQATIEYRLTRAGKSALRDLKKNTEGIKNPDKLAGSARGLESKLKGIKRI